MDDVRIEGMVNVTGAEEHPHAARRLRQEWPALSWAESAGEPNRPSVALQRSPELSEGAFRVTVEQRDGAPQVTVTGGPFSGTIYGVEELIQRLALSDARGVSLQAGTYEAIPTLPYRTFWTWDHSTNWDLEQIGVQEIGVFNPYGKPPDGFLADYTRLVDFMSRNRIPAVVIYGMFRDSHRGVETAQALCQYANERGVRILPGIAINAYGGVYWEGDHPFNLATWLRKHPELSARMEHGVGFQIEDLAFPLSFPRSDYTVSGCPSRPENQQWMADGVAWLAETCDIGGINIESGDYGVCGCDVCTKRRAAREDANRRGESLESWSHADMADFYPRLFEAARTHARRDDLWLYSELQWDNMLDTEAHASLRALPPEGIYQHTLNRSYWNRVKEQLTPEFVSALPTKTNVFRAQFACQWNGTRATDRYKFNGRDFAGLTRKAAECGLQGLTVWGEVSAFHAATELSYLAFARFTYDPTLTWNRFITEEVAPRLGGERAAARFLEMTALIDGEILLEQSELRRLHTEAVDASRQTDYDAGRRWLSLADRIARREMNLRDSSP
ncbi:MAG: hypothetical protein KY456_02730 [Chloroflexi bacterium]|nr:hypothetical protein [Chloroflexota bacterium]